jgi:GTP-binding protein Era
MRAVAEEAARDCDVALLLVDAVRGWEPPHAEWLARLVAQRTPVLLVATQCDRPGAERAPWPPPGSEGAAGALRISARTGAGLEALLEQVVALLQEAPAFYPDDELTDRPLRFLAAEAVREAAFEALGQELPYRIAVEVTDFDESDPELARIRATILVERDSQKRIVIGAGGAQIKAIGIQARREIERLVGRQVHLALWVKVEPGWARKPKRLKSLGYC